MELSFSTPYTAMGRERERIKPTETGGERNRGQKQKRRKKRREKERRERKENKEGMGVQPGQAGGTDEGKERGSWQRAEEENIRAIHDVMSLCGLGLPQTTTHAQMFLNEA